jgi:RNase P/RNase MRP subunit POP5
MEQNYSITETELIQAIRQQTHDLFSKTSKELGLWVVQFDGNTGIIKFNYTEKEHTIQLLQSLKKIGLKSVAFTTYTTSGTIRGIIDKKLKHSL